VKINEILMICVVCIEWKQAMVTQKKPMAPSKKIQNQIPQAILTGCGKAGASFGNGNPFIARKLYENIDVIE
jgi:uncharacterized membrane protein